MSPHPPERSPDARVDDVQLPDALREMVGPAAVVPVWRNQLGGLTFRVGDDRYLKWSPHDAGLPPFAREVARLAWAAPYTTVPDVLDAGTTPDGEWLLTAALPGESAVAPRWLREPRRAAAAIGAGLRALHDALPVADCPFSWSVAGRLAAQGIADYAEAPPPDRLVVCHGDPCAPNTLIGDDGEWAAHVDLGSLGVADRWADLAVATYSLGWNYGEGYDDVLLTAYGIEADVERIAYYRELWDAE